MNLLLVLVAAYFAYFVVRTLVLAGGAVLLVRRPAARRRRVYRRELDAGQQRRELTTAVMIIAFDAVVLAASQRYGLVRFAPPSVLGTAGSFVLLFVWYEVWFYGTHRLLHTRWLLPLHRRHHEAKVTDPLTSLSFSLGERVILHLGGIGFTALVGLFHPLALTGVGLYFVLNFVLNVLGHSNVEMYSERFVRGAGQVWSTPSYHSMHHARWTGHYGLFTRVCDRIFGSEWPDYPEVHARAVRGEGLTRLGERLD